MSKPGPPETRSAPSVPPRYRVLLWVGPLVGLALLLMASVRPEPQPDPWEYVTIGLVYGTLFGQATLAAAWTALGPLPLVWRLPLSLVWLVALIVALAVNVSLYHAGSDDAVVLFGLIVSGQWLLAQAPLWCLAMGYALRLRYIDDGAAQPSQRQFGIRQLMLVTAVIAVVLGIGRAAITAAVQLQEFRWGPLLIISFLAVAGVVMMLPLLLAALLPRLAVPASLLVLVCIGLGTAGEVPLVNMVNSASGSNVEPWHLVTLNMFQAAWVLLTAGAVRCSGYGLAR